MLIHTMYVEARGRLKEIWWYRSDVQATIKRTLSLPISYSEKLLQGLTRVKDLQKKPDQPTPLIPISDYMFHSELTLYTRPLL